MFELIYTSLPHGLLPGRSGFTTAAMTAGMPPNLVTPLENLSGYSFTFSEGGVVTEELNPPSCCYIKLRFGNRNLPVAGRIAPCGLDYSKRNNKIAHHILFETTEELLLFNGGAAEIFFQKDGFAVEFSGEAHTLPFRKLTPQIAFQLLPAAKWQELTGSTGYAAMIAERFRKKPQQPFYLKYPQHIHSGELLQLTMEICALLTPEERLNFTFNTYFTSDSAAIECFLRMIPDFSPLLPNLKRFHKANLFELDAPLPLPAEETSSPLYEYASSGQEPQVIDLPETTKSWNGSDSIEFIEDLFDPNSAAIPVNALKSRIKTKKSSTRQYAPGAARKIFFMAAAAIILLCIVSLACFIIPGRSSSQPAAITVKVPVAAAPGQSPSAQPAKPEKKASAPKTIAQPALSAPQNRPAAAAKVPVKSGKRAAAAKAVKPSVLKKLPLKDAMKLFLAYREIIDSQKTFNCLALPAELHHTDRIDIDLDKIGIFRINKADFVRADSSRQLSVAAAVKGKVPLQPYPGKIDTVPHLQIFLPPGGASLNINYMNKSNSAIIPELSDIKRFYFTGKNFYYYWDTAFSKEFIKLLTPGKVHIAADGKLSYVPSASEKTLGKYIQRSFGNCSDATFRSSSLFLAQWNQAIKNLADASKKSAAAKKTLRKIVRKNKPQITKVQALEQQKKIKAKLKDSSVSLDKSLTVTDQYIACFSSSKFPDRNTADIKDAENFLRQITPLLTGKCENKAHEEKLKNKRKAWDKALKDAEKYRALQQDHQHKYKHYQECSAQLAAAYKNTISAANKIHPDFAVFMKGKLSRKSGKTALQAPAKISSTELISIAEKIKTYIRITPAVTSTYGENYEQDQ